jgi:hypothetical protein
MNDFIYVNLMIELNVFISFPDESIHLFFQTLLVTNFDFTIFFHNCLHAKKFKIFQVIKTLYFSLYCFLKDYLLVSFVKTRDRLSLDWIASVVVRSKRLKCYDCLAQKNIFSNDIKQIKNTSDYLYGLKYKGVIISNLI